MKKIETKFEYKDFKNKTFHEGIKEKIKTFPMKNITTVELVNAVTGEVEVSETAENLVKSSSSKVFENMYEFSFAEPTRETREMYEIWHGKSKYIGIQRIELHDDQSVVVETEKTKWKDSTQLGYAYNYATYSGSDTKRGSIHLNGTYMYEDPVRKARVYSTMWEWPTHACNGTINKVALMTDHPMDNTDELLESYHQNNCRTDKKITANVDGVEYTSRIVGDYIYYLRDWRRNEGTGGAICKAKLYERTKGKDVETGSWVSTVADTEEVLCNVNFNGGDLADTHNVYTGSNDWAFCGKSFWFSDDGAYLYVAIIKTLNSLEIHRIATADGTSELWLTVDTTSCVFPTYSSYIYYVGSAIYFDEANDKFYLALGGGQNGYESVGSHDNYKCDLVIWRINGTTKAIELEKKVFDKTIHKSYDIHRSKMGENVSSFRPVSFFPTADGISLSYSTYCSGSTYNYYHAILHFQGNTFEKCVGCVWTYYNGANRTIGYYFRDVLNGQVAGIKYDTVNGMYYGFNGTSIYIGFDPSRIDIDETVMENLLPVPITKTTNHLLRVRYEVLIPWKTGLADLNVEWSD